MKYEDALRLWGARKIASSYRITVEDIVLGSVRVDFTFDEGYACCGGSDPNCYCSFAESPRAEVAVSASTKSTGTLRWTLDLESFDFATVLSELCETGDGMITS